MAAIREGKSAFMGTIRSLRNTPTFESENAVPYVFTDLDGITHRFYGSAIAFDDSKGIGVAAYKTSLNRIAVLIGDRQMEVFDTFEEFIDVWEDSPTLASGVAESLNIRWVHDLEI